MAIERGYIFSMTSGLIQQTPEQKLSVIALIFACFFDFCLKSVIVGSFFPTHVAQLENSRGILRRNNRFNDKNS